MKKMSSIILVICIIFLGLTACKEENKLIDKDKRMEDIQNKIKYNDTIYNYLLAEERFNILMDNINKIIAQTIKEDYK